MPGLSQDSLYELIYAAIEFGDNLFEIWLTVTFAAILAIYFTREHISAFMRYLLMGLYTGAAILLTGRWCVAMVHILFYMDQLAENDMAPFPTPQPFGMIMGIIHLLMFVLGSIATLYFMKTYKGKVI